MYNILSFRLVFYPPYVPYHNTCLNLFAFTGSPPVLYGQDCTYLANCYISLASGPPAPHKSSLNWTEPQKLRAKTAQASFNMTACTSRTSSPAITSPFPAQQSKILIKEEPPSLQGLICPDVGGGVPPGHMLGYISLDGWGEVLSQWLRFPNTSSKLGVWLVTRRGGESTFLFGSAKDTA